MEQLLRINGEPRGYDATTIRSSCSMRASFRAILALDPFTRATTSFTCSSTYRPRPKPPREKTAGNGGRRAESGGRSDNISGTALADDGGGRA